MCPYLHSTHVLHCRCVHVSLYTVHTCCSAAVYTCHGPPGVYCVARQSASLSVHTRAAGCRGHTCAGDTCSGDTCSGDTCVGDTCAGGGVDTAALATHAAAAARGPLRGGSVGRAARVVRAVAEQLRAHARVVETGARASVLQQQSARHPGVAKNM